MIKFECQRCKAKMQAPESQAGETEHCPECGHQTPVPIIVPPSAQRESPAHREASIEQQELRFWQPTVIACLGAVGLLFWAGAESMKGDAAVACYHILIFIGGLIHVLIWLGILSALISIAKTLHQKSPAEH